MTYLSKTLLDGATKVEKWRDENELILNTKKKKQRFWLLEPSIV